MIDRSKFSKLSIFEEMAKGNAMHRTPVNVNAVGSGAFQRVTKGVNAVYTLNGCCGEWNTS